MSARHCPACGGPLALWRSARASEPSVAAPIPLLRCGVCGTAVTDAPVAEDAHDSGAYADSSPRGSGLASPLLSRFDRTRLELVSALSPPPGRLVDVGAGRGRFVAAAREAGYRSAGIEPSDRGVTAGLEHYGVLLQQTSIEQAEVEPASVDVVTLWHVLEHVEDPRGALEAIAGWLRPGGGLVLGVPNLASWQARIGGTRWFHLDLPRHRTHFTPAGLEAILAATGFEVVGMRHRLLEHNPFGMWQSAVNRLTSTPSYLFNLLKRNAPLRSPDALVTLAALPLLPVAAVVELAAAASGHGGTVAVSARRAA